MKIKSYEFDINTKVRNLISSNTYIAHIDKEANIQSVKEHCLNVANICGKFTNEIGCYNIGYIIGILHDIGKLCNKFKSYIIRNYTLSIEDMLDDETITYINNKTIIAEGINRGDIDHAYAGGSYLLNIIKNKYDYMLFNNNFTSLLTKVIMEHHGITDYDLEAFTKRINKSNNIYKKSYDTEISNNIELIINTNTLCNYIEKAYSEYLIIIEKINKLSNNSKECGVYHSCLERYLVSCLIDADNIDTQNFMYKSNNDYIDNSEFWLNISNSINTKYLNEFSNPTTKINQCRFDISNRCMSNIDKDIDICTLSIATGGGKTLTSLRFGSNYAYKHNKNKLFYVAPFNTINEQNASVIKDWVGEQNVLEHFINVSDDNNYTNNINKNEYIKSCMLYNKPIITTSLAQTMNTFIHTQNRNIRHYHHYANSVIIFDEVQSIPLDSLNLFIYNVNFLANVCNSTIIQCTATQPRLDNKKGLCVKSLQYNNIINLCGSKEDCNNDFINFKRTNLIIMKNDNNSIKKYYDIETIGNDCWNIISNKTNVLIVNNTKLSAINIYMEISKYNDKLSNNDKYKLYFLTTDLCPKHRMDKFNDIKKDLSQGNKIICVSTQLIEAGVDISFECVIRTMCGIPSIMQSAGRCNRNGEYNKLCDVYLMYINNPKIEFLGSLQSIRLGKCSTSELIKSNDINDNNIIDNYYNKLYNLINNESTMSKHKLNILDYILKDDKKETIVNLLSKNNINNMYYTHLFNNASDVYSIYPQTPLKIIIPYDNKAKQLIDKFINLTEFDNPNNILYQLQAYTINAYSKTRTYAKDNNNNWIIYDKDDTLHYTNIIKNNNIDLNIIVCKDEYYGGDIGFGEITNKVLIY